MSLRQSAKTLPLLLLLLYLAPSASACMCSGQIEPCRAYAAASVVFVGVVTEKGRAPATGRLPQSALSMTLTSDAAAARFRVEETFLGSPGAEVVVSGEGTTCDYYFEVGERYLVYGNPSPDGSAVNTHLCSGTARAAKARAHLSYLRGVARTTRGGTFVGDVARPFLDARRNRWNGRPLPGVEVILEAGGRRFSSTSDAKGEFAVRGLPRGRYRVRTRPATNHSSIEIMGKGPRAGWELDMPDHGCVKEWFWLRPVGEISGRVTGAGRVAGEDLWVEILFAEHPNTEMNGLDSAKVEPDGSFKFSFLPAGRYLIGFNLKTGPFRDYPFAELYYPGVAERERATVIELGSDAKLGGLKLLWPARLGEGVVEGVAVWPDGRPAVGVSIQLNHPRTGWRDGNPVTTDAQGRFSINGIEGLTYELTALVNKGVPLVNSKPLVVKVEKAGRPVRLVIELP